MRLTPQLTNKPAASCDPGELVLVRRSGDLVHAIVTEVEGIERRSLIYLDAQIPTGRPIWCATVTSADLLVVSFGKGYHFEALQFKEYIPPHRAEFERNGALLIGLNTFIRINSGAGLDEPNFYYDIATGVTERHLQTVQDRVAVPCWNIRLDNALLTAAPFFSFG